MFSKHILCRLALLGLKREQNLVLNGDKCMYESWALTHHGHYKRIREVIGGKKRKYLNLLGKDRRC